MERNTRVLTSELKVTSFTNRFVSQGEVMSVRKGLALLVALSALLFLAACGSSNGPATAVAPPSGGFSNSNLNGTYVFSVSGIDAGGAPFAIVGTFMANGANGNGKGGITGGTIDINDSEFGAAPGLQINNNGFYSIGVDGRGQITIGTAATNPFNNFTNGDMTFDVVMTDSFHGLITEFDGNGTGSGTIDTQTANTAPTGSYAFSFSGTSGLTSTSAIPAAAVGAFTLDNGTITAGAIDFNNDDFAYANQALSGAVTLGPSTTPSTTLGTPIGTLTFDVYSIDATHLKFIETDSLGPVLSGDAFSQTSNSISGTLTFTLAGFYLGNTSAAGGFMVTDGNATITSGTEDYNNGGAPSVAPVGFSGSYTSAGSLIPGRSVLTLSTFFGGSTYAAYPSSGGLLLLEIDGTGLMVGAGYPQTSTTFAATSEGYGLNFTGSNLTNGVEVDDIAEFTASAAASGAGTLTNGIVDENFAPGGTPLLGVALTNGSYAAVDTTGRYSLGATALNGSVGTLNGGFGLTFYTVDGTNFPFIETDTGGQVATGTFVVQNPSATTPALAKPSMFMVRPLVKPHGAFKKKQK
jgi:hypothetical protein